MIEAVDIILCSFIIYVFASKLIYLITEYNEEEKLYKYRMSVHKASDEALKIPEKSYVALNEFQKKLVKIMTKWTLLIVVGVIVTQLYLISKVLSETLFALEVNQEKSFISWESTLISQPIQSMVSVLGVYLMFEFGNKTYKICCGKLHKYFRMWFNRIARDKVKMIYEISLETQAHNKYVKMEDGGF